MCHFADCKSGFNQGVYGNDEQTPVWWHMDRVHHLPTPLDCPTCDKRFASPLSQKKHISGKCGQLEQRKKKFRCPERGCKKMYTEQKSLEAHIKTHDPNIPLVIYVCPTCGKDYRSSSALREHEHTVHLQS